MGTWYGVTTDSDGRVTRLALYRTGLSGSIPSELGDLDSLERLYLSDNELSGAIPAELANLENLLSLNLNNNELSGPIPSQLANIEGLEALNLASNQLSGSIPAELGNLNFLSHLHLSGNQLSGCIPESLRDIAFSNWVFNDLKSLGLLFCGDATATPTATATATATPTATTTPTATPTPTATQTSSEFTSSGSGSSSDPYIIADPTNVAAHSVLSYVSSLNARDSVYFRWNVGNRAGTWTITTDASPTSHDFDLYGRDDRGSGWDDQDRSGDGDERIDVDVLAGGYIHLRVQNYDGGAPTDLTLTIEAPDSG